MRATYRDGQVGFVRLFQIRGDADRLVLLAAVPTFT